MIVTGKSAFPDNAQPGTRAPLPPDLAGLDEEALGERLSTHEEATRSDYSDAESRRSREVLSIAAANFAATAILVPQPPSPWHTTTAFVASALSAYGVLWILSDGVVAAGSS